MAQRSSIPANPPQIKPTKIVGFHTALAHWYRAHGRHALPWRNTRDPYAIWLSEVMLQQTQVATVRDRFYAPFLQQFPTVEALAAAPREAVMKAWEGLGYYRRAGHLHEAARRIAAQKGPKTVPADLHALLDLPGIGKNTAHAVLAFAYRQPVAILEANVKRIVARIFALETPSDAQLWAGADALLDPADPFDYNQAMMDLGSQVCTPRAPSCSACPAAILCQGQADPENYPAPKAKKAIPTREVQLVVLEDAQGRYYLKQRASALLGGLYSFIEIPRELPAEAALPSDSTLASVSRRGNVSHIYSHFRLDGVVQHLTLAHAGGRKDWYTKEQIERLPLSALERKVLALVDNSHTGRKKPTKRSKMRRTR